MRSQGAMARQRTPPNCAAHHHPLLISEIRLLASWPTQTLRAGKAIRHKARPSSPGRHAMHAPPGASLNVISIAPQPNMSRAPLKRALFRLVFSLKQAQRARYKYCTRYLSAGTNIAQHGLPGLRARRAVPKYPVVRKTLYLSCTIRPIGAYSG